MDGGSADAGAVLRALEALCPQPIGTTALLALAGTLGADVPFLTTDATLALGWSRGDRLLALPPLPRMAVTLVACSEGVNTGAAYAALAAARRQRAHAIEARAYACDAFASWDSVCALAVNDFEDVVMSLHREVAATLPALRAVAARLNNAGTRALALMSGSGATCALIHPAGTDVALNGIAASRLRHTATSG